MSRRTGSRRLAGALLTAGLFGGCSGTGDGKEGAAGTGDTARDTALARAADACPDTSAGLRLPEGFCATVFADSLGKARHVAVSSTGDVYVTLEGTEPSPEKQAAGETQQRQPAAVVALRDTSRDGRADVVERIPGVGNTGVRIHDGWLYVDAGERIVRHRMQPGVLAPAGEPETIVRDVPLEPGHRARNFAIGPDGGLYLNIGSISNSCQLNDREEGSRGMDPCTELETRAGLWRFDANTPDQRVTRAARWATGIRNGMGLAFHPASGQLYATQHGRDQLRANWPRVFPDWKYSAQNPGEELLVVNRGDVFGWPYCYYDMEAKRLVTAPEYGGNGKRTDRCADKKAPLAVYPAHWAPMDLLFYDGRQFPERYRGGAFIAFHGSWNRAPEPQAGYRVVFQPMRDGRPQGEFETFADGFAGLPPEQVQPGSAKHRPVGLAAGPDGSLYVTDDAGGRVYRITYGAAADGAGPRGR